MGKEATRPFDGEKQQEPAGARRHDQKWAVRSTRFHQPLPMAHGYIPLPVALFSRVHLCRNFREHFHRTVGVAALPNIAFERAGPHCLLVHGTGA
jgi:hypothetical protein